MKIFTTRVRARYADTDTSGIVYYASYFLYFETGRFEMFRELGLPYDHRLPIVETACRYRATESRSRCRKRSVMPSAPHE
jgi:acyl-CoA thioester hydrolase